jgi:predicted SnoaL-like aldol condensation-catalyzing enzyme
LQLKTAELSFHVLESGSGELALLFLHCWGGSARTWNAVTSRFSARGKCREECHRLKVTSMKAKQRKSKDPELQEISEPQTTGEPFQSSAAGQERIRRRAYAIYLERGGEPRGELDDWLRAEREANKTLVLEAFDTLFNQRECAKAECYWSPNYVQHSAHIEPGREGLFNLVKSSPPTLKLEAETIVAEGDFVIIHGRYSGTGLRVNWIVADILRIKDGVLVEHWDVIQDEGH